MSYPYLYPGECPTLDDIREAMAEQRPMGADTRSGLVGWWPGRHRGSILRDFSGNARHGTWSGTGTRWAVDAERQGVVSTFNGSDDYVKDATARTIWGGMSELTIMAWARIDGQNTQSSHQMIFYTDSAALWYLRANTGGNWTTAINTVDNGFVAVNGSKGSWSAGAWNHVAFRYRSGDGSFFQNGVTIDTKTTITGNVTASATTIELSDWYYLVNGRIDDPRVYRRYLSNAEIRHIYDCGRVAPLSDLVEPLGWETVGVSGGVVVPWHLFGRVA